MNFVFNNTSLLLRVTEILEYVFIPICFTILLLRIYSYFKEKPKETNFPNPHMRNQRKRVAVEESREREEP